ncbi:MAG: DUF1800 domain-containing protein [Acidobacteriaceae bacterium]
MVMPQGEAFAFGHKKDKKLRTGADTSPLSQDQRVLQALNRLTFGPRPGDVAAVEAMGLDKWIDQQLHPETIDDSALDARLSAYPAMQLNLHQLTERFPAGPIIRKVDYGKMSIPRDPVVRAIYESQLEQLRQRRVKQAEQAKQNATQQGTAIPVPGSPQDGDSMKTKPTIAMIGQPEPIGGAMESGNSMAAQPSGAAMEPAAAAKSEARLYADLQATSLVNLEPQKRVDAILAMPPADFRDFFQHLNKNDRVAVFADLTPVQKETLFALINPQLVVGGEVVVTRLLRDIYSQRQLEAVMTDFWLNHFNVYLRKNEYAPWYLEQYQDHVIRPHALGKFEDLLVATAESPAMLYYLDQTESVGPHSFAAVRSAMNSNGKTRPLGLNENYAREVMELHTLGVDGGYTQRDVTQLAEVFTGWGIDHPDQGAEFTFNPKRHEPGQKIVLGYVIPENGQNEGLEMLHKLATSPATAHHVSFQIAQRFVSDNPPPALVNSMATTWLKTDGDISEVLKTMLASKIFWSEATYRDKVKTPEEYVISAVRATGGEVVHPAALVEAMGQLGMPLYGCQTPNGYAWTADAWLNSGELLDRMNFSLALADNNAGTEMRWDDWMSAPGVSGADATAAAKESKLETLLLDESVSQHTRDAVLAEVNQPIGLPPNSQPRPQRAKQVNFVRPRDFGQLLQSAAPLPPPVDQDAALLAGLLLGSPEFQRR